jgi:hypothetical protein
MKPGLAARAGKLLALICLLGAATPDRASEADSKATAPVQPELLPDLASTPKDLNTPETVVDKPSAGRRVRQVTPGYESTDVHHTLYLPTNWQTDNSYPVIVEYPGNGNYTNKYGDRCSGTVEGCNLGYGISGGSNYLWVCMPFVQLAAGGKQNATLWWGDVGETVAYCTNTLRFLCDTFGADDKAIILTGSSRGAIACNYIGLHDDRIASIWRAFIPFSHYDGVITNWPYPGADRASALERLRRLAGRPQFICQEGSTKATEAWLRSAGVNAPFRFTEVPFRNHSDQWVLRDVSARRAVRRWLRDWGLP